MNVRVTDTGVGFEAQQSGLGSGLAALRERLELAFGGDAELTLEAVEPRGARAMLEFSGSHAGCMKTPAPTALIADDEPLLRDELARLLASEWPELVVVAQARNGREAMERFDELAPDVCFLDVQMPGGPGVEAAQHIGRRAHIVFVTAYDQYAVQAFAQGVLDYLVKPVEPARLAATVARLQERLQSAARPAVDTDALLRELAAQLQRSSARRRTLDPRVGRPDGAADFGRRRRLPALDREVHLDCVAQRSGEAREAVVRTPLKELVAQLDAEQFAQVHRSVVVNLRSVAHVARRERDG